MNLATIKLDDIHVGERERQEMGDLHELGHSIKKSGLISPLAVMETPNAEKPYLLLAGGRRLEAMKHAEMEMVGIRIYPDSITPLESKTIELAENFHRKDLTWQEQVSVQKKVHSLQQEIHGEKQAGGRPDVTGETEGWGTRETAEMVGRSQSSVVKDIQLAEAVEAFPELFKGAKTKTDASKIVDRMQEHIIREELAQRIEEETLDPDKTSLIKSFIIKDFFEGVKDIPDRSIDFVEIDPPYGIDLKEIKRGYIYGETYNEVSLAKYPAFLEDTFRDCYRVMADHSWLVCWFGPEPWFNTVYELLLAAGFSVTRMCGIWTKPTGQTNQPALYLANSYEMFFYARKGKAALARQGRINTFDFSPVASKSKSHPTERPVELMQDILTTFAWEGSRVMVPFLGSGNTLIAAHLAKMTGFGFELGKEYKDSFVLKVNEL